MKKKSKNYKSKKKATPKKSKFMLSHPLVIPVTTFVVLFFVGLVAFVMLGASTQGAADARIVSIFTDGEKRTVTTRAKTVGELLERANIQLVEEDIVEPAKDSLILEDNTHINIYRARSVQLVDGDRKLIVFTAQRAPRLVAADAGVELLPEDEATFERLETDVLETSATEQLSVKRSKEVQLNLYGVVKKLRTTADTVEELLEQENVTPAENELIQPESTSQIKSGILVSVNRPGVKTVSVNEPIPFESVTEDDDSIEAGQSQIKNEGQEGIRAVIYEIEEKDGQEISRKQIQVVNLKEPVNKVVLRGTKIVQPTLSPSTNVSGDKVALMTAAGISAGDHAYVDFIIAHESGWRPGAANSYSGAYGLCQSLPASKMASAGGDYLTNPVTQLRWCSGYANGRYGSWGGAYNAWLAQGWW